jgi:hypothetical protein
MELRLSSSKQETHISEADSRLAGEKFPAFEGPTCFFPCHNSLSLDHVLRQLNLISNYLHTVSLYSILPSTLSSRKWQILQVFFIPFIRVVFSSQMCKITNNFYSLF